MMLSLSKYNRLPLKKDCVKQAKLSKKPHGSTASSHSTFVQVTSYAIGHSVNNEIENTAQALRNRTPCSVESSFSGVDL